MKNRLLLTTCVTLLLLLASCASEPASTPAKSAAAAESKAPATVPKGVELLIPAAKINAIAKGMRAEDVRAVLGSPTEVNQFTSGALTGEIWTYRIAASDTTTQVPTAMRDVPGWDPFSNRPITLQEPVYQVQHIRTYDTLDLLIVDGRLIERKPGRREVDNAYY
jgi:hypothetical protein